jgi:hypothetical protein
MELTAQSRPTKYGIGSPKAIKIMTGNFFIIAGN